MELNIHSHPPLQHYAKTKRSAVLYISTLALVCSLAVASTGKDKPPVQYHIPVPTLPDFSPLDWLQGRWTGKTQPGSPPGEVQLTVSPELERHFLVLRGEVSLGSSPTAPPSKESWMGVLSANAATAGYILCVFSSTGFITRYQLVVDGPELQLNPEGGDSPPAGWLFRRIWVRTGPDELTETVQAAPPGKAFFNYYVAKFSRVPPSAKSAPTP